MQTHITWIERYQRKRQARTAAAATAVVGMNAPSAGSTSIRPGQPSSSAAVTFAGAPTSSTAIDDAVRKERMRIRSILQAPEAVGREDSAAAFAFESGLDADAVKTLLRGMQLDADHDVDAAVASIVNAGRPRSGA